MKTAEKDLRPATGGELRLLLIGLALLLVVTLPVLLGLGPAAGGVTGVVLTFLLGFLGAGLLAAVLIQRWCERRGSTPGDDPWS